ncbi:MAG: ABC transporter substrate-binding protein [Methylobacteriaceae bacterium]|jgi:peptide/nickel transport system substrate-binding protein|nr:ABC transporter substrate-binding protein [Methylobacteriaceae bacterium]
MITRRNVLIGGASIPLLTFLGMMEARADTPKDVLVVAMPLDNLTSLDPHESFEGTGSELCSNIYQRLVAPNRQDPSKLDPILAESWEADADGKVFTFKIRQDAKFATGNPVTAEDVAFSLHRVVSMSKGPAFIINQFGYDADNVQKMIVAEDPTTLKITTGRPVAIAFLLYCLSHTAGSIVEKKVALEKQINDKDGKPDWGNEFMRKNSAGSGSFKLISWKPSENLVLEVNPHGDYKGNIKRIMFLHVTDPATQLLMLEKGDVDVVRNLGTEQLQTVLAGDKFNVVETAMASTTIVSLNQKVEALRNPKVWQAIRWAIDYEGIQKNIVPLTYKVHQTFLPEGFPGAIPDMPYKQDLKKAKELLTEAGYPDGFDVSMDHYAVQPVPDIAQVIQANLAEIGIRLKLLSAENRQVLTKMRAREHEMALTAWASDYYDPHSEATAFVINEDNSDNPKNKPFCWRSSWQNEEMNKKAIAARDEKDPATRIKMYEELQRDHYVNSPFIFLLQRNLFAVTNKNVEGVYLGALSTSHSYKDVVKK